MLLKRSSITVSLRNKRTKTFAKYANAHMRIRVCPCAYMRMAIRVYGYIKYARMLITIYELAYCCFLCNTVVECCFNGPVILGLYGPTKGPITWRISARAEILLRLHDELRPGLKY